MKNKLLRITCALFALCLLLSSLSLSVSADNEKEWSISRNYSQLFDGTTVYTLYELPYGVNWLPTKTLYIHHADSIKGMDEDSDVVYALQSVTADSGILYLESTFSTGIYVSNEAREDLAAFEREENVQYRMCNYYTQSTLSYSTVQSLNALTFTREIDVTELRDNKSYDVVYYDSTGSLYRQIGILFYFDGGGLGYVNFSYLNNTHFDAYGNLSFRSGTVPVCPIGDHQLLVDLENAEASAKDLTPEETYEYDTLYWNDLQLVTLPLFWILFTITGAVLPAVGLTLGLVWARSKKQKHPARWYVLVGLCGLWLLLTLIIFLMLII